MRINTKGHMVFQSELEAQTYARLAAFDVAVALDGNTVASRTDMNTSFVLQRLARGNLRPEYMWYRGSFVSSY